jgi:DNA polymerase-4
VNTVKKIIFLVDMNAFYIGCEMARKPELKGMPAAVAGDPKNRGGIILSPNYDARKYGVKTTMLIHEARKLCPNIVFVSPEHSYYSFMSGKVMDILARYAPVVQQNSIDEAWLDLTGCEGLFGRPREIAEKIMKDIMEELDLWCSIGISENKFLSKMASEMKKPLGISELWQSEIKEKLWPLKVRDMYGVGKQSEKKLNNMGIFTIGDIAKCDRRMLIKEFGKYGEEIHMLSNGMDPSPVDARGYHENKSISRSTTLSEDTADMEYLKNILLELAEEVGLDARRQEYKGKTVSIVVKYSDFQTITRQKSLSPTNLTKEIYETGVKLLEDNWNKTRPIRLIGIGISGSQEEDMQQMSLFDISPQKNDTKREEKLEKAMDAIKEKYGLDSVKRARLIKSGSIGKREK